MGMQGLPGLVIFTFHCGIVYSVVQVHQVQEKNFQNWFGGNNIIRSKLSSGQVFYYQECELWLVVTDL